MSGKFPPMKAWICIYAIVFAAGMLTALAEETNTQTGATTNIPANNNGLAVPPPMTATSAPAPVVAHKVKPPVVVPLTQTSAVPAQTNITAASLTMSTSAPAVAGDESLMQTSAVPAQSDITAAPPAESFGTGRKGVWAISVAFLAVAGGLTVFLLRRSGKTDHASLITRAMSESKDEDKHEEKPEEKQGDTKVIKKFPPPMT
jgi:hypothetical protein